MSHRSRRIKRKWRAQRLPGQSLKQWAYRAFTIDVDVCKWLEVKTGFIWF
jgi:hypothetical protein